MKFKRYNSSEAFTFVLFFGSLYFILAHYSGDRKGLHHQKQGGIGNVWTWLAISVTTTAGNPTAVRYSKGAQKLQTSSSLLANNSLQDVWMQVVHFFNHFSEAT